MNETAPAEDWEAAALLRVREFAETGFRGAKGSHDWDHTLRVFRLCEQMGRSEGADLPVLRMAAYLHDIGRGSEYTSKGAVCHAEKGADIARPLLLGLGLSPERRENVLHAIRAHRFRGRTDPKTPEAKILFDADKIDAIGAVGVARAFLFAGEVGARLHSPEIDVAAAPAYSRHDTGYREYLVKLRKIRERIMTCAGKKMAEERHAFMEDFFRRFLEEYDGER
jgi:uncharacterized protein